MINDQGAAGTFNAPDALFGRDFNQALVHQIVQTLIGHGYGEQDFAALVELEAQAAGLQLESENSDISDGLDQATANRGNAVP